MQPVSSLKLAIAEYYQYGLHCSSRELPDALVDVRTTGLHISAERLSERVIHDIGQFCQQALRDHPGVVATESNGADSRIYGVDRLPGQTCIDELGQSLVPLAQQFYGADRVHYFCMFGQIQATSVNAGSGSGWHRDSPFRHQFKSIIYLTDVTEENGPFEFIRGTHQKQSLVVTAAALRRPLAADRFADTEIASLHASTNLPQPTAVIGPAGSIVHVDTRGLHRGRPLRQSMRRAITFYFYAGRFPKGIPLVPAA